MKELITYPLNDVDYSAEDAGLFHCTRKSGVWYEDSFLIEVSGADNTIFIGKGLAWFSNTEFWGKVAAQKTKVSLDLEYADPVYDRIDVIALQFDANKNATNLIVKKGEAKTNPTIPSISRTEAVYELYLYAITRPAASLTVTSENVRDLRLDDAYCGLMADSVTSLDFPVVPIEKGGTNATNRKEAIKNLIELPTNTEPSEDTPSAWNSIGTCKIFFNTSSEVLNKPTGYGTLLNFSNSTVGVVQIWFKHGHGDMFVRAGNATGWNNSATVSGADAWKIIQDKDTLIDTLYPVNSVIITSNNENPGDTVGGTWQLIDKYFSDATISSSSNASVITTYEGVNCTFYAVRGTRSIRFTFRLTFDGAYNSGDIVALNLDALGISGLSWLSKYVGIPTNAGAKAIAYFNLNTQGILELESFTGLTDGAFVTMPPFTIEGELPIAKDKMLDEACDKFYWKRTS